LLEASAASAQFLPRAFSTRDRVLSCATTTHVVHVEAARCAPLLPRRDGNRTGTGHEQHAEHERSSHRTE
jgi:hypothetical protein